MIDRPDNWSTRVSGSPDRPYRWTLSYRGEPLASGEEPTRELAQARADEAWRRRREIVARSLTG